MDRLPERFRRFFEQLFDPTYGHRLGDPATDSDIRDSGPLALGSFCRTRTAAPNHLGSGKSDRLERPCKRGRWRGARRSKCYPMGGSGGGHASTGRLVSGSCELKGVVLVERPCSVVSVTNQYTYIPLASLSLIRLPFVVT